MGDSFRRGSRRGQDDDDDDDDYDDDDASQSWRGRGAVGANRIFTKSKKKKNKKENRLIVYCKALVTQHGATRLRVEQSFRFSSSERFLCVSHTSSY